MEYRVHCPSCKEMRVIMNPIVKVGKTRNGYRVFASGNCSVCGGKASGFVKGTNSPKEIPKLPELPPATKLIEQLRERVQPTVRRLTNEDLERMEREARSSPLEIDPDDFRKEDVPVLRKIKDNRELNKIARSEGVGVGDPYKKWFLISIFVAIGVILYSGYSDYYKSDINLVCGNLSVESNCPEYPACPSLSCGDFVCNSTSECDCTIPEELLIQLNSSLNES